MLLLPGCVESICSPHPGVLPHTSTYATLNTACGRVYPARGRITRREAESPGAMPHALQKLGKGLRQ